VDQLDLLRQDADRFVQRFAALDADARGAAVAGCPGWDVDDLAFHLGTAWFWFERIVAGRLTDKEDVRALPSAERPAAPDLAVWVRERADGLLAALAGLGPTEPLWNFTRKEQVGAFVPRRMHHETAVHLWDLEAAVGEAAPIDPEVARDGLDELLTVLVTTGRRFEGDRPVTLRVVATDPPGDWTVALTPGERPAPSDAGDADVTVRGAASALLLVAWGRLPLAAVSVEGSPELAAAAVRSLGR
jgi:uncharacterized protein (TIGR03083 family)